MAAPALAQAAYETIEPLVGSQGSLDPALRGQPKMPADFEQQAEVTPGSSPVQAADAGTDDETVLEKAPSTDEAVMAAAPAIEETETNLEAEAASEAATMAQTEPMVGTEAVAEAEPFAAPINVAALPDDYSADDLNAMMRARLNVVAVEIADANAEAGTYAYASADTFAPAQAGSAMPEEVAISPEAYAAIEPVGPALGAGATAPSTDTAMMAEDADGSLQMADQNGGLMITAQGDIDQTAVEIAARDDRFTNLVELVGIAGLEEALSLDGPYTVFAPTNEAFAALAEATLAHLKSEGGKAELVEILQAHVVEGTVMAGDVAMAGQAAETIGDRSLNVIASIDGSLNVRGSNTIGEGIYASNGLVYAVDAVILPQVVPAGTQD